MIVDDVSIRKNVEDLRNEVERDPLTGVLNRRGFEMTLEARLSRLLPGETLGLMFLDLDGFKAVNDTLGHKAGDQILKTSATLLKGATRNVDHVARLGVMSLQLSWLAAISNCSRISLNELLNPLPATNCWCACAKITV